MNTADGSLPPLDGAHTFTVYATDSGYFAAGQHLRVIVQRPDGSLSRSPVVTD